MSNGSWKRFDRRGLTLVEVIAGLVLLATLLTSVLAAFKTHAAQIRSARARLQAAAAADELVAGWMAQDALPRVGTQKPLEGADGWAWRLLTNESQRSGPVKIGCVRVEIFRPRPSVGDEVLASVTLVVPGNMSTAK
jgi:prepilin-type N-terminal cleavage/methylation domain-containing protein